MPTKKKEELQKKEQAEVGAVSDNYDDDAGSGMEGSSQTDFTLAFISIAQLLSKGVIAGNFVEGSIFNSATGKTISGEDGISFVPVLRTRRFVEWIELKRGGGRVGDFLPEDPEVLKAISESKDSFTLKIGDNDLIETFYMYGIIVDGERYYEACIPFKSAAIRKYKGWMVEMRALRFTKSDGTQATYPTFAHRWRLTTIPQSNTAGDFYNWEIGFDGKDAADCRLPADSNHYQLAKQLHEFLVKDGSTVSYSKESGGGDQSKLEEGAL